MSTSKSLEKLKKTQSNNGHSMGLAEPGTRTCVSAQCEGMKAFMVLCQALSCPWDSVGGAVGQGLGLAEPGTRICAHLYKGALPTFMRCHGLSTALAEPGTRICVSAGPEGMTALVSLCLALCSPWDSLGGWGAVAQGLKLPRCAGGWGCSH